MSKKTNNIVALILLVVSLFFIIKWKIEAKQETDYIFNKSGLAIGEVVKFIPSGRTTRTGYSSSSIEYKYSVNSILFQNGYSSHDFYIPSNHVVKGESYLVVYHIDSPQISRILFDKPIFDSTDYLNYQTQTAEILKNRKHNTFYKNIE